MPNRKTAMINLPVSLPPQKARKHSAEEINRAMARFPLLIRILAELNQDQIPLPGDADIRHGCERALTAMLSELSRIESAPSGKSSKAEEAAHNWLQNPDTSKLIDADKLVRIQLFIDRILKSPGA